MWGPVGTDSPKASAKLPSCEPNGYAALRVDRPSRPRSQPSLPQRGKSTKIPAAPGVIGGNFGNVTGLFAIFGRGWISDDSNAPKRVNHIIMS